MKAIIKFRGLYNFLSNFHKSPITYQRKVYPTAEHLFQALKTTDLGMRDAICQTGFPGEAKSIGQKVQLRENWDKIKDKVMFIVVKLKFLQNDGLRKHLLNTEESLLIEGNYHHDNYWGDCYCSKCRQIKGRNQLGKILMKIREAIQQDVD